MVKLRLSASACSSHVTWYWQDADNEDETQFHYLPSGIHKHFLALDLLKRQSWKIENLARGSGDFVAEVDDKVIKILKILCTPGFSISNDIYQICISSNLEGILNTLKPLVTAYKFKKQ